MIPRVLPILALVACLDCAATDVNVIGLFPGKVVVTINRGAPRTLSAGEKTPEGVVFISSDANGALFEIDGKRQTLEMGQHFASNPENAGGSQRVTLSADPRGHYFTDAQVNGGHVRFMVDTGATVVSLSAADAARLGIDYRRGRPSGAVLADGRQVAAYRVMLDSVTVGGITLFNVEASVTETGMPLLGMSFLHRMEMRQEGQMLILTKRY